MAKIALDAGCRGPLLKTSGKVLLLKRDMCTTKGKLKDCPPHLDSS
jgi:hypothetical protein